MNHNCYARLRRKRLCLFTNDEIDATLNIINKTRFENLFRIKCNEDFQEWIVTGADWFKWLHFKIMFHRQRLAWRHDIDIIATEWVMFTMCHKAIRALDPKAKYRDEGDSYLSEPDFDLKFPTLDIWIRALDTPSDAEFVIQKTKGLTPDCFWHT